MCGEETPHYKVEETYGEEEEESIDTEICRLCG